MSFQTVSCDRELFKFHVGSPLLFGRRCVSHVRVSTFYLTILDFFFYCCFCCVNLFGIVLMFSLSSIPVAHTIHPRPTFVLRGPGHLVFRESPLVVTGFISKNHYHHRTGLTISLVSSHLKPTGVFPSNLHSPLLEVAAGVFSTCLSCRSQEGLHGLAPPYSMVTALKHFIVTFTAPVSHTPPFLGGSLDGWMLGSSRWRDDFSITLPYTNQVRSLFTPTRVPFYWFSCDQAFYETPVSTLSPKRECPVLTCLFKKFVPPWLYFW